jgi:glycosyltransferase involved in cell wall biosynthesis
MTVLFVVGAGERAGAERVLLTLARAVDRSRVRPVVAFLDDGPFVDEVRMAGIEVVQLGRSGRLRNLRRVPRTVARLRDAIESVGADVVQATGDKMSVYAGWAARLAGRPCVFWLHNAPGTPTWFAQLAMTVTPRASVVACSRWMADAFRERLGLPAVAIQNGLPLDELPVPPGGRGEILVATGWPCDAVVVGHFARLQRWKGTEVFIRACAEVAERHERLRFLVVGGALFGREQEYADSLPRLAAELGLGDRIHFTGFRPDALDLMAASDVVAHCSLRADPFPTVVLEAMALGRPVVATRTRGPEESLDEGRTGLLVAPGDHVGLAGALDRLAGSPGLRDAIGRAAREEALEHYSAERFATEFEDHWSGLVGHRAGVPG